MEITDAVRVIINALIIVQSQIVSSSVQVKLVIVRLMDIIVEINTHVLKSVQMSIVQEHANMTQQLITTSIFAEKSNAFTSVCFVKDSAFSQIIFIIS